MTHSRHASTKASPGRVRVHYSKSLAQKLAISCQVFKFSVIKHSVEKKPAFLPRAEDLVGKQPI